MPAGGTADADTHMAAWAHDTKAAVNLLNADTSMLCQVRSPGSPQRTFARPLPGLDPGLST